MACDLVIVFCWPMTVVYYSESECITLQSKCQLNVCMLSYKEYAANVIYCNLLVPVVKSCNLCINNTECGPHTYKSGICQPWGAGVPGSGCSKGKIRGPPPPS
jgi:hypothetical protein